MSDYWDGYAPDFPIGCSIRVNPEHPPSGLTNGWLDLYKDYKVISKKPLAYRGQADYYIRCNDGQVRGWLGCCFVLGNGKTMPDPDWSLEEIEVAKQTYEKLK